MAYRFKSKEFLGSTGTFSKSLTISGVSVLTGININTGSFVTTGQTGNFLTTSSNVVYTTGNQTINGTKTFASSGIFNSGVSVSGVSKFYNRLDVSGIKFDVLTGALVAPTYQEGLVWYSDDNKALNYYNDIDGDPIIVGQEEVVRGTNNLGVTINKGQVVYITGAGGGDKFPGFQLALASEEGGSARTIGVTTSDISNNQKGYAISFGRLEGIDTTAYNVGDTLYLSWATSGGLTGVKPQAPNHMVRVGVVLRQGNSSNGVVFVNVQNGFELEELHNVRIINEQNKDTILWDSGSGLWLNRQITTGDVNGINNFVRYDYVNKPTYLKIRDNASDVDVFDYSVDEFFVLRGLNGAAEVALYPFVGLPYISGFENIYSTNIYKNGYSVISQPDLDVSLYAGYDSVNTYSFVLNATNGFFVVNNRFFNTGTSLYEATPAINFVVDSTFDLIGSGDTKISMYGKSIEGFNVISGTNIYQNGSLVATDSNLSSTGSTLQGQITTLNNWTGASTGLYYPRTSNPSGYVTTGQTGTFASAANLAQTGATLSNWTGASTGLYYPRTSNPSGYVLSSQTGSFITTSQTGVFVTTGQTGVFVLNNDSTLVRTTGVQTITGTKYFNDIYANNLYVNGTETIINTTSLNVADNFVYLNATGGVRDAGLFINFSSNSGSGAYIGWDIPSNSWRFGSGVSGIDLATLDYIASQSWVTSQSYVTTGQTGAFASAANLAQTGSNLQGQITTLNNWTGSSTGLYYPRSSNPSGYVLSSQTGNFVTTSQTGLFYPASNPSGFITSAGLGGVNSINVTGSIVSGNVILTGAGGTTISLNGQTITISSSGGSSPSSEGVTLPIIFKTLNLAGGSDNTFVQFTNNFSAIPSVWATIVNNSGDPFLGYNVSGISTSGFYLSTSTAIPTNNYKLNYIATTGDGFLNIGTVTGSINGQNIGDGSGILSGTANNTLNFKTLKAGQNIVISGNSNDQTLTIHSTGSSSSNSISNFSKGGGMYSLDGIPSGNYTMPVWRAHDACTITGIHGYRIGGTAATVNVTKNNIRLFGSHLSLTSTGAWISSSLISSGIAKGDDIEVEIVTVSGFPTGISIQVDFSP